MLDLAENSLGISYGNEISFSTNNGLIVTTGSYDINGSSVDLYAQIIGIVELLSTDILVNISSVSN